MQLLNEKEAAQKLKLSRQTLAMWRTKGKGPNFIKLGNAIRYSIEDLKAFIDGKRIITLEDHEIDEK
jgi:predicted site-specific integrase-resolvase